MPWMSYGTAHAEASHYPAMAVWLRIMMRVYAW
jgi:hypothetical protein